MIVARPLESKQFVANKYDYLTLIFLHYSNLVVAEAPHYLPARYADKYYISMPNSQPLLTCPVLKSLVDTVAHRLSIHTINGE